jgi:hypothetical protein
MDAPIDSRRDLEVLALLMKLTSARGNTAIKTMALISLAAMGQSFIRSSWGRNM